MTGWFDLLSDQISHSVVSDSLRPHESQHARPPCPTLNSQSSLRLTSIESVMPSSHLILCRPLVLLPPIPPSIRVFSNESTLYMQHGLKVSVDTAGNRSWESATGQKSEEQEPTRTSACWSVTNGSQSGPQWFQSLLSPSWLLTLCHAGNSFPSGGID